MYNSLKNLMFKQEKCYHKEMVITSDPFTNADCIIIAFAQPFSKQNSTNASNELLFTLYDNSFSMQAKGQKNFKTRLFKNC
jgi:hypothetical protein